MGIASLPILMTASICTNGMKGACFSDEEREKQYCQSLQYYLDMFNNTGQKIVFAENSGWDLNQLQKKLSDISNIEFISLSPKDFDISKGKGYNELLLINQTIAKSVFIKEVGAFFKVTGRYPIINLSYFVDKAIVFFNDGGVFYGDMKDHSLYDLLGTGWNGHSGEARLFGCINDWYFENLGKRYRELNDYTGDLLEKLLFDVLKNTQDKVSKRFHREPHFGGLEGSNNTAFSFSKKQNSLFGRIKRFIGNIIRWAFPFWWF